MAFLTREQIEQIGFQYVGINAKISDKASFYNPGNISIGHNCRIDDFCILSAGEGGIVLEPYVHIACYVSLIGKEKIHVGEYAGISARTSVYSSTDTFDGSAMVGPCIPEKYTKVVHDVVMIGPHSVIGAGCIVLPGSFLGVGCAVGAMSLVKGDILPGNSICYGIPAVPVKERKMDYLRLAKEREEEEMSKFGQIWL